MRLLLTGGAGYIGTQTLVELLRAGHDVVVLDDLSSGNLAAVRRAEVLGGRRCAFVRGDIADAPVVLHALRGVDAVLHFAAFKMAGESMDCPQRYFRNNVGGMAALLEAMEEAGVRRILYSSSAAVYGTQREMPVAEDRPLQPDSAYGVSKVLGEEMLGWMVRCLGWSAVSLRYFNPVGAHASGYIGEPIENAASLVPCALRAISLGDGPLTIFGTDYDTPDGTCLRDYIHVRDLARAHVAALASLERPGHAIFNVGTGRPHSVREVLAACARAVGREVPFVEGARRPGDVPCAVADPRRFQRQTGFVAELGLDEMVASAWNWLTLNPRGYRDDHMAEAEKRDVPAAPRALNLTQSPIAATVLE